MSYLDRNSGHKKISIAKEGYPFIFGFLAAAVVFSLFPVLFLKFLAFILFLLTVFSVYFFRDPQRNPVQDPAAILAPGDGLVMEVNEEFDKNWNAPVKVLKIFLSVFDVHVQHSPIPGKVLKVEYRKGTFLDARHARACLENEQNAILIENEKCRVIVKQIAGLIARRIVCWVRPGETVALGQKLGLIRFGSQVDLVVPADVQLCVSKGDRVISGVSVVGILKNQVPQKELVKE